eukprot:6681512-Pyramimonas_sp.AAC.1
MPCNMTSIIYVVQDKVWSPCGAATYACQSMLRQRCGAVYVVQYVWGNGNATYVVQCTVCTQCGAIYGVQSSWSSICVSTYGVQATRCNLCGAT